MALHDFVPAAWNGGVKQAERNQRAPNHDRGLNQIGPDDSLDPTERRVDGGQNDNDNRCADVDEKRFSLTGLHAANHFIRKRERDRRYIQARTGRQHTRNHENSGCRVFRRHAEARGEIFVDRINFVVVVRLDENVADENASEDGAEGELQVGIIAVTEAFPGRSEKSAGACFGGDQSKRARPTTEFGDRQARNL